MTQLRMIAVVLMAFCFTSSAFAETTFTGANVALLTPGFPLGLKVCMVGAALGAAVERLISGGRTRRHTGLR